MAQMAAPLYARGTIARARETAAPVSRGAEPGNLACGYYRVREGESWRVARWMPKGQRWEVGGGFIWPVRHWDEIGAKVA